MTTTDNPALRAFVAQIQDELILGQVLICRTQESYKLRHVDDRSIDVSTLRVVALNEVRALCQFTAQGNFRPLKSAPNLRTGWLIQVANDRELQTALQQIYPGAVADWHAAQSDQPPLTHFREFTKRQSGMYRITALLSDEQAARTIRAGCGRQFCLKRRLWTIDGLAPDGPDEKSLIPCLEPCPLLLEFARKSMRIEQQEKMKFEVGLEELATMRAALEGLLSRTDPEQREGDFNLPVNPRRVQLLLEKLSLSVNVVSAVQAEQTNCEKDIL